MSNNEEKNNHNKRNYHTYSHYWHEYRNILGQQDVCNFYGKCAL